MVMKGIYCHGQNFKGRKNFLFGLMAGSLIFSAELVNGSSLKSPVPGDLEKTLISKSCGTSESVSQNQMFKLIQTGHERTSADERVRCPGFFAEIDAPTEGAQARKPITVDLATKQRRLSDANNCNIKGPLGDARTSGESNSSSAKEDLIQEMLAKTSSAQISQTIRTLTDGTLGPTRYHASNHRRKTPEWIMDQFKRISNGRADIHIRLVEHSKTSQPSVEAIIEGVGPDKNKFVVIGGHEDSINAGSSQFAADSPAPGADDNASGIATVLESFRVLVESGLKPNASIAFYAYAAEEVGLVGSQEVARDYANAGKEVLGVVQVDMSSYSSGPMDELTFITDYTSSTLTATAAEITSKYLGMKVSYDTCGYACSDHASWTKYNFRSILPAEKEVWTSVKRIHTVKDQVDALVKPVYVEKFAKLSIGLAITLGF